MPETPSTTGRGRSLVHSVHDRSWMEPGALCPRPVVDGAWYTRSTTGRGWSLAYSVHDRSWTEPQRVPEAPSTTGRGRSLVHSIHDLSYLVHFVQDQWRIQAQVWRGGLLVWACSKLASSKCCKNRPLPLVKDFSSLLEEVTFVKEVSRLITKKWHACIHTSFCVSCDVSHTSVGY